MLINISNHPSAKWSETQKQMALDVYGSVTDINFPAVDPELSKAEIIKLAKQYYDKIMPLIDECANHPKPVAVHIQGEFTFVYNLVEMLKMSGIICIASTSKRNVVEKGDGQKIVKFEFVQFREF